MWFLSFIDVVCGFERLELLQGGMCVLVCVCVCVCVCLCWAPKTLVVVCRLDIVEKLLPTELYHG